MSSSMSACRAAYVSLAVVIVVTACRSDSLAPHRQIRPMRDGVSRAESLAVTVRAGQLQSALLDNEICTIKHDNPGEILGCTMLLPQVTPSDPWLEHSGGIYEPEQTAPISIKLDGPVYGVSLQSTGALKCSGSSIGRVVGYRNGVQVEDAANVLTDPSDCGGDDVTFGVTGGSIQARSLTA